MKIGDLARMAFWLTAIIFPILVFVRGVSRSRWLAFAFLLNAVSGTTLLVAQVPASLALRIMMGLGSLICAVAGGVHLVPSDEPAIHHRGTDLAITNSH